MKENSTDLNTKEKKKQTKTKIRTRYIVIKLYLGHTCFKFKSDWEMLDSGRKKDISNKEEIWNIFFFAAWKASSVIDSHFRYVSKVAVG